MQTTLNIDEGIVERLYAEAKRRGTTASALAEAGIRQILGEVPTEADPDKPEDPWPELPEWNSGGELVDITNKEELYRVMDAHDGQPPSETVEELMDRLPKWRGGELLVDISNKEELRSVMDEYDGFRY